MGICAKSTQLLQGPKACSLKHVATNPFGATIQRTGSLTVGAHQSLNQSETRRSTPPPSTITTLQIRRLPAAPFHRRPDFQVRRPFSALPQHPISVTQNSGSAEEQAVGVRVAPGPAVVVGPQEAIRPGRTHLLLVPIPSLSARGDQVVRAAPMMVVMVQRPASQTSSQVMAAEGEVESRMVFCQIRD
jgi:hypothetical protein